MAASMAAHNQFTPTDQKGVYLESSFPNILPFLDDFYLYLSKFHPYSGADSLIYT